MDKHAKEVLNGFGLRPKGHARKHAMDVLKPVWTAIVGYTTAIATMAWISLHLLDCTARLCLWTYPQEPMLYVYGGASPWQCDFGLGSLSGLSAPSALGSGTKHPMDDNPVGALDVGGLPHNP